MISNQNRRRNPVAFVVIHSRTWAHKPFQIRTASAAIAISRTAVRGFFAIPGFQLLRRAHLRPNTDADALSNTAIDGLIHVPR